MDGAQRIGTTVSAAGHIGLVVWVLLGGVLFRAPDESLEFTSVSLVSSDQFAEMEAAASQAPRPEVEAPEPAEAPKPETEPPPPDAAASAPDHPPATSQPPSGPVPEAAPDAAPDVTALAAPPAPEVAPEMETTQPAPPQENLPELSPDPGTRVRPRPAPRIAPVPTEAPEPDAAPAETAVAAAVPDPQATPDTPVEEPVEAAAPPEAGDVIETEANREEKPEPPSLAPLASPRPRGRPAEREAAPEPVPAAEPEPEPAPAAVAAAPATDEDAVAAALAAALAGSDTPDAAAPTGPPLTGAEKDALRVAVSNCWNIGSLSSDAQRVTVTVEVAMAADSRPDAGSIRMMGFEGGEEAAARQAYEAARRAIIRCGAAGFGLPADKYDQWKVIEMVFNPESMRIR